MPQSHTAIYVHIVFSTKNRHPYLKETTSRDDMHAYLAATSRELTCPALLVGGVADHVHLLSRMHSTSDIADLVKELKRASSLWIKKAHPALSEFSWQAGYGGFSVSASHLDEVRNYISNQETHHSRMTFQDEYRALLRKHEIEWDERYVWD